MKIKRIFMLSIVALLAATMSLGWSPALKTAEAGAKAEWKFHDIVSLNFVQQHVKIPKTDNVMIIDARPYKPKYVKGHIPTAVSIPHSKFDQLKGKLPKDKNALLIFYCGGLKCKLSHKSAWKAEKMGYKNVKVFAAGFPAWMKGRGNYAAVSAEYVAEQMDSNKAVIIDSRPFRPKYIKGHVPTAMSIPDSQFNELAGKLPLDVNTPLVFYCGGFKCPLSHKSAKKAIRMGYTNVKVFSAGYPDWKKYAGGTQAVQIRAGKEEGSIDISTFKKIVKENPDSILLVDSRSPEEYKAGSFRNAVNIPNDELEKKIKSLPSDKPIVFVCNTGALSGEAYYMVKDMRPDIKEVYYLEAEVTYKKDGTQQIKKTP